MKEEQNFCNCRVTTTFFLGQALTCAFFNGKGNLFPTLGRQCYQVSETAKSIRKALSMIVLVFTLNVYHCRVRLG